MKVIGQEVGRPSVDVGSPSALTLALYGTTTGVVAVAGALLVSELVSLWIGDLDRMNWLVRVVTAVSVSVLAGYKSDFFLRRSRC